MLRLDFTYDDLGLVPTAEIARSLLSDEAKSRYLSILEDRMRAIAQ